MDPSINPYTPTAGRRPPALTGRDEQLAAFELLLRRLQRGRSANSMIISGLRGVGKTVLLNEFARIADRHGWQSAKTEARPNSQLRGVVARMTHQTLRRLSRNERARRPLASVLGVLKAFSVRSPDGFEIALDVDAALGPVYREHAAAHERPPCGRAIGAGWGAASRVYCACARVSNAGTVQFLTHPSRQITHFGVE